MLIPLRQAVIHSDFMARISVLPIGIPAPHGLHWSHGACNLQWGEASAEDLIFALLQTYALLTREAGIPAHRFIKLSVSFPNIEPHYCQTIRMHCARMNGRDCA